MDDYKSLKGVLNTQDVSFSNNLLENFIVFYDWGFTNAGGFYNIDIPESGLYGGDKHKLRAVDDPNYNDGQVWEGYRSNWVWETGVANTEQPTRISGVFIGDTFRATGNIQQPFHVNYPNGRVVFDSAISTTSEVKLEYAHKWISVIPAEGVPWFREIQEGSMRLDNDTFTQFGSGDWAQLGQTRVQMPAVAIDVVGGASLNPFQLGGGQNVNSDLLFYVVTENHWECTNIMDQIVSQNDREIWLFDSNKIAVSGVYPFDYRGEINENALPSGLYPQLVDNHRNRRCYINNSQGQGVTQLSPDLYIGVVRCSTEITNAI